MSRSNGFDRSGNGYSYLYPGVRRLCPAPKRLTMADWHSADIAEPDYLLGDLFSTTTRAMVSAPTGIGETMLLMQLGLAMSQGRDVLHWRCRRPAEVLYIEAEMSERLTKRRAIENMRRAGIDLDGMEFPKNFHLCCLDELPERPPPLNTQQGQKWYGSWINYAYEFVIFDNIQALLAGNLADEETWKGILPWTYQLTQRAIGQIWVDHTGLDKSRPYGTSTKSWQMDTSILLEEIEAPWADIALRLKFLKARERTPENRADFAPVRITLERDQWFAETVDETKSNKPAAAPKPKSPSPAGERWHSALIDAAIKHGKPRPESGNRPSVRKSEWLPEAERLGLLEPLLSDSRTDTNRRRARVSKYQSELIEAAWIAVNGDLVWSMRTNA